MKPYSPIPSTTSWLSSKKRRQAAILSSCASLEFPGRKSPNSASRCAFRKEDMTSRVKSWPLDFHARWPTSRPPSATFRMSGFLTMTTCEPRSTTSQGSEMTGGERRMSQCLRGLPLCWANVRAEFLKLFGKAVHNYFPRTNLPPNDLLVLQAGLADGFVAAFSADAGR